jgi:hypothetical protein
MEYFRVCLLKEFGLDVYDFITISNIANRVMEERVYWSNGNLYDLANKPREFISKRVHGDQCVMNSNQKQMSNEELVDFDAVSLYPSAMKRLYCFEGVPKVLTPEMLSVT